MNRSGIPILHEENPMEKNIFLKSQAYMYSLFRKYIQTDGHADKIFLSTSPHLNYKL